MNPDGSMQTFNSSTSIQTMAAGADGTLWLFRQTSRYADDGTEGNSISELIQLDAHGTLLRTITPVSEEETDDPEGWRYTYIDSILSDDKGYVYTYDHQTVNVYGPDGSFVFSKSGDELNGQICQLSASEVGMTTSSADGKMVFKQLDPETKDWGKGAMPYEKDFKEFGRDMEESERAVKYLADAGSVSYTHLTLPTTSRV